MCHHLNIYLTPLTLDGRRVMADQVKLNMTIDLKRATSSWNENKFLFLLKQLHYKMPSNSHKIKTVAVFSLFGVKNMEGAI